MKNNQTTWWRDVVERYERPHLPSSIGQIINSVGPYLLLWALMVWTIQYSYLLTLLLVIPAAGFWIRIFIICHDCGHGSFFVNRKANHVVGAITGLMTLTPYRYWRLEHARHHGSSGNLDRRGIGDIWTMTVDEYRASSWWRRLGYRLYRNPLIMFGLGSFYLFAVRYRLTAGVQEPAARHSVYLTNAGLLVVGALLVAWLGLAHFLMIFVPLLFLASSAGVWLFYVQHQFEGVYWERDEKWDYLKQAMEGSSFYRLLRSLACRLWDERRHRLVGFAVAR